jgi:hypothetical protein
MKADEDGTRLVDGDGEEDELGRERLVDIEKSVIDEAAHNHWRKSLVERRLDNRGELFNRHRVGQASGSGISRSGQQLILKHMRAHQIIVLAIGLQKTRLGSYLMEQDLECRTRSAF